MPIPVAPSRASGESSQPDFEEPELPPPLLPPLLPLVLPLLLPLLPELPPLLLLPPPSASSHRLHGDDVEPSGVGWSQVDAVQTPAWS